MEFFISIDFLTYPSNQQKKQFSKSKSVLGIFFGYIILPALFCGYLWYLITANNARPDIVTTSLVNQLRAPMNLLTNWNSSLVQTALAVYNDTIPEIYAPSIYKKTTYFVDDCTPLINEFKNNHDGVADVTNSVETSVPICGGASTSAINPYFVLGINKPINELGFDELIGQIWVNSRVGGYPLNITRRILLGNAKTIPVHKQYYVDCYGEKSNIPSSPSIPIFSDIFVDMAQTTAYNTTLSFGNVNPMFTIISPVLDDRNIFTIFNMSYNNTYSQYLNFNPTKFSRIVTYEDRSCRAIEDKGTGITAPQPDWIKMNDPVNWSGWNVSTIITGPNIAGVVTANGFKKVSNGAIYTLVFTIYTNNAITVNNVVSGKDSIFALFGQCAGTMGVIILLLRKIKQFLQQHVSYLKVVDNDDSSADNDNAFSCKNNPLLLLRQPQQKAVVSSFIPVVVSNV
jgi:hypothetical protein